jgi:hypothetical protein
MIMALLDFLGPIGNKDGYEGFRGERSWEKLFHPELVVEIEGKTINDKLAPEEVHHHPIFE